MDTRTLLAAAVLATLSLACAKKGPETATTPAQAGAPSASVKRDANVISAEELSQSSAQNVYSAIQMMRPSWFRARARTSLGGGGAAEGLIVYLNGSRYGGVDALTQLTLSGILEVRYLDPSEATTRYGTGHTMGAILIKSK